MGTLNAFYLRLPDPSDAAAIRAEYPNAYTDAGSEFFAIEQGDDCFHCPESELQLLSARLNTDVIWMSFQSVVDAFQYYHWSKGDHLRTLVYGCFENEREWEQVEGLAQPWEADALFGDLPSALRFVRAKEDRSRIEQIYRARIIKPGAGEPNLDARKTAQDIVAFYRFPGWTQLDTDAG